VALVASAEEELGEDVVTVVAAGAEALDGGGPAPEPPRHGAVGPGADVEAARDPRDHGGGVGPGVVDHVQARLGAPGRAVTEAEEEQALVAAGDGGGGGVAALGAAGQPSDLERQGGHAGGRRRPGKGRAPCRPQGRSWRGARGAAAPGPQIKEAPSQASTNNIVYKI
jgi:hypothetical protein